MTNVSNAYKGVDPRYAQRAESFQIFFMHYVEPNIDGMIENLEFEMEKIGVRVLHLCHSKISSRIYHFRTSINWSSPSRISRPPDTNGII
jgi:hypothetical protein